MKHIILGSYILIFSTGFAALVGLVLLDIRLKGMFFHRMVYVQGLFIANLALVAVYYYMSQVLGLVSGEVSPLKTGMGILASLLNIALYVALLSLLHSKELGKSKNLKVARFLCMLVMALLVVGLIFHLVMKEVDFSYFSLLVYLLISLTLGYFGVALVQAKLGKAHPSLLFLVKGMGWCSLAFIPLGIAEYVLSEVIRVPYQPLSLEYFYYLGCNCIIVLSAFRSFSYKSSQNPDFGTLEETVASRFSLTGREKEMAQKIAQGKSNKEIAFDLGISEATVRTHIYNLYQKVGAQSRIELLNLLHD
jgi:DNA-binding CsgD family transcriptional regulator